MLKNDERRERHGIGRDWYPQKKRESTHFLQPPKESTSLAKKVGKNHRKSRRRGGKTNSQKNRREIVLKKCKEVKTRKLQKGDQGMGANHSKVKRITTPTNSKIFTARVVGLTRAKAVEVILHIRLILHPYISEDR